MASFITRAVHVARLNSEIYDEIEHDPRATWQAIGIVAVVSLLAALTAQGAEGGVERLWLFIWSFTGDIVAIGTTYVVGSRLLREPPRPEGIYTSSEAQPAGRTVTLLEFFRVVAFARAPGAFIVIGAIIARVAASWAGVSFLVSLFSLVIMVWVLFVAVGAVQHALDYASYWRAWIVLFIGGVVGLMVATACVAALRLVVYAASMG